MKVSYIINSAAADPLVSARGNMWRDAGYSARGILLEQRLLPAAVKMGFDEIIVAGCWKEGAGYTYVPVEPLWRDRRDALWQREIGARFATGDVLVFGHDDHAVGDGFVETLRRNWLGERNTTVPAPEWDLLVPRRVHGITGAELNNGKADDYMGGHLLVMKRWLWAKVPWTSIDSVYWDTSMTRLWKTEGGKIVYADDLTHVDVEALEDET